MLACFVALIVVPLPLAVEVALIAALYGVIFALDRWAGRLLSRWSRGAVSEEKVGALLDAVEGWHVLHDVDLGRGNVDHLVVGPGGIFAIETKSWQGYFDSDRFGALWWRQAYRQAKTVERAIERSVHPIVVVCGARTKHAVTRRRGVTVLSERLIAGHLQHKPALHDADEVAAMFAHAEAALARSPRTR
ncbi:MAG: NERD domain-containing protein [Actinomycetota bacterium]|nr:NERD domain-containing protein [Actinomycetota bacterium]